MSPKEIYVECATAEEVDRALAVCFAVTTTMEVADECGAEFEGPEDVPAIIESHRRPNGEREPPPGPLYPVLD